MTVARRGSRLGAALGSPAHLQLSRRHRENGPRPLAFVVDHIVPGHVIPPHFGGADQSPVFGRDNGTIGKHELGPVTVHYVAGDTPPRLNRCWPQCVST